jgi:glycosyltransferase involved in cell wall biosynthesis
VPGPDGDQEGLGLVLVEAAGCGCPVVAGDVVAIHDVVDGPDVGAVVNPADPQALADALLAAMSGAAGSLHQARVRATAVSRFDWEQRASAYAGVLEAHSRRD